MNESGQASVTGNDEGELESLRTRIHDNPKDLSAGIRLAQLYSDRGWFNESITVYRDLLKRYPDDFSLLLGYGNVCFCKQYFNDALQTFSKITFLKPSRIEGWNNLGIVQLTTGEYDAAYRSFRKVLELEPENHGALLNLGNYYHYKNEIDTAGEYFKKAAAVKPDFIDAWYNLGNIYSKKGLYKEALEAYERSMRYDPTFYSSLKNTGYVYEQLEQFGKAEEFYCKALAINKTDAGLYVNIGHVYKKQHKIDSAKEYFMRAVKIAPREAAGWLGLREISLSKGDIRTYIKATMALVNRLDEAAIASSLFVLLKLQQYEHMQQLLQRAESLHKHSIELDALSMVLNVENPQLKEKAAALYEKQRVFTQPSDIQHYCMVEFCIKTGRYAEVQKIMPSASCTDDSMMHFLWISLIGTQNYDKAEQNIRTYLQHNPDCFRAWYHLARIESATNRRDDAVQHLRRAFETGFTDLESIKQDTELRSLITAIFKNNSAKNAGHEFIFL